MRMVFSMPLGERGEVDKEENITTIGKGSAQL